MPGYDAEDKDADQDVQKATRGDPKVQQQLPEHGGPTSLQNAARSLHQDRPPGEVKRNLLALTAANRA